MQTAKAAILLCLAIATGSGTWYLRIRAPDNQWRRADEAGEKSMDGGRFSEAERHFMAAVEAARAFGDEDPRLARSLFHRAQALCARGRYADALPHLEQALSTYEKAHGPNHRKTTTVREYYYHLLRFLDRSSE